MYNYPNSILTLSQLFENFQGPVLGGGGGGGGGGSSIRCLVVVVVHQFAVFD